MNQRQLIKKILLEYTDEQKDEYQDIALDNLSKVGNFNKLRELDKLTLLGRSGDIDNLKKLSLEKIYKEKGGTFDKLEIKVRVKDKVEQPINHQISKEMAQEVGFIESPIFHLDDIPYVTIRFKTFEPNKQSFGGGNYKTRVIPLANIFPVGNEKIDDEFVKYRERVNKERDNFKRGIGGLDKF